MSRKTALFTSSACKQTPIEQRGGALNDGMEVARMFASCQQEEDLQRHINLFILSTQFTHA